MPGGQGEGTLPKKTHSIFLDAPNFLYGCAMRLEYIINVLMVTKQKLFLAVFFCIGLLAFNASASIAPSAVVVQVPDIESDIAPSPNGVVHLKWKKIDPSGGGNVASINYFIYRSTSSNIVHASTQNIITNFAPPVATVNFLVAPSTKIEWWDNGISTNSLPTAGTTNYYVIIVHDLTDLSNEWLRGDYDVVSGVGVTCSVIPDAMPPTLNTLPASFRDGLAISRNSSILFTFGVSEDVSVPAGAMQLHSVINTSNVLASGTPAMYSYSLIEISNANGFRLLSITQNLFTYSEGQYIHYWLTGYDGAQNTLNFGAGLNIGSSDTAVDMFLDSIAPTASIQTSAHTVSASIAVITVNFSESVLTSSLVIELNYLGSSVQNYASTRGVWSNSAKTWTIQNITTNLNYEGVVSVSITGISDWAYNSLVVTRDVATINVDTIAPSYNLLYTRETKIVGTSTFNIKLYPTETIVTPQINISVSGNVYSLTPIASSNYWIISVVPTPGWASGTVTVSGTIIDLVGNANALLATLNIDTVTPSVINITATTNFAFGHGVTISATVTDNIGLAGVKLVYRVYGTTGNGAELAMANTAGNTYAGTIPATQLSRAGMEYYILASDLAGFISVDISTWNQVQIIDQSAPLITPLVVTNSVGGKAVLIVALIEDDSVLVGATLNYQVSGNSAQKILMTLNGQYYEGLIPATEVSSSGNITYYIEASDSLAQTNYYTAIGLTTNQSAALANSINITVTSSNYPVLSHTPITTAERGQDLKFWTNASDSNGVMLVRLKYSTDGGTNWSRRVMAENQSQYETTLSGNLVSGTLQYYVEALDYSNNLTSTNIYTMSIADTTAPIISHVPVSSTGFGVTLNLTASAYDSVAGAISPILTYRKVGTTAWQTVGSGYQIPGSFINSYDKIEYKFSATDGSNTANFPVAGTNIIEVSDLAGPYLSHGSSVIHTQFQTLTINAVIVDSSGIIQASVFWRMDQGTWQTATLLNTSGSDYSATIAGSGLSVTGNLQYYIQVTNNIGQTASLPGINTPNVVSVVADTIVPSLKIVAPQSKISNLATLNIQGVALDDVLVATLNVYLNGTLKSSLYNINGDFTFSNLSLNGGRNTVNLTAFDSAGNTVTASTVITIQSLQINNASIGVTISVPLGSSQTNAPISAVIMTSSNFQTRFGQTLAAATPLGTTFVSSLIEIVAEEEAVATGTTFSGDGVLIQLALNPGTSTGNLNPFWWDNTTTSWVSSGLSWTGTHNATGQALGLQGSNFYFASTHLTVFAIASTSDVQAPAVNISGVTPNNSYAYGTTLNIIITATDNVAVGSWTYQLNSLTSGNIVSQNGVANLSSVQITLAPFSGVGTFNLLVTVNDTAATVNTSTQSILFYIDVNAGIAAVTQAPVINSVTIRNDRILSGISWVRDGDSLTITANVTDNQTLTTANIFADLQGFSLGSAVTADSYINDIAQWRLTGINLSKVTGSVTVRVSVLDSDNAQTWLEQTITADNQVPELLGVFVNESAQLVTGDIIPLNRDLVAKALDYYDIAAMSITLLQNGIAVGSISSASNTARVTLNISTTLTENINYSLEISAYDLAGNGITQNFSQLQVVNAFQLANVVVAPNPFNPDLGDNLAHFGFVLSQPATVRLYLHNISGRKIWSSEGSFNPGYNEITWNGSSSFESKVANGLYLGYLVVEPDSGSKQIKLLKLAVIR